ncbi:MAG: h domain protein [Mycobacteriales bacterium]
MTVLLAALVGVIGWFYWQQTQVDSARTDGLAAARAHAATILSYDYRHIDADIAKGKAATTGKFREEYSQTTSTVVKPTAVQYKAIVQAQVRVASVRSASPDQVVVLLFVNQTTTSTRVTGPKVDQSRVRMTLEKHGDRWLVSKIDAL